MYTPRESGLGIAPAIAAVAIPFAVRELKSLLQSSDPVKDGLRYTKEEGWYLAAEQGDTLAEARLRCAAGEDMRAILAPLGEVDSSGGCANAAGSDPARQYAQALVARLPASRLQTAGVGGAAGGVGTWLLAAGVGFIVFELVRR